MKISFLSHPTRKWWIAWAPNNGLLGASHHLNHYCIIADWNIVTNFIETESNQHNFHKNEIKMSVKWRSFYFGLIGFSRILIYQWSGIDEIWDTTIHVVMFIKEHYECNGHYVNLFDLMDHSIYQYMISKCMRHTVDYFIGLRWRRAIRRNKTYENIITIWMAKQWKMSISKLDQRNIFLSKASRIKALTKDSP